MAAAEWYQARAEKAEAEKPQSEAVSAPSFTRQGQPPSHTRIHGSTHTTHSGTRVVTSGPSSTGNGNIPWNAVAAVGGRNSTTPAAGSTITSESLLQRPRYVAPRCEVRGKFNARHGFDYDTGLPIGDYDKAL